MGGLNSAVVIQAGAGRQLRAALRAICPADDSLAVSGASGFCRETGATQTLTFDEAGLLAVPFDAALVAAALRARADTDSGAGGRAPVFVVDMRWGLETPAGAANFDVWGGLCSDLAEAGLRIVSVYDWELLIGAQMLTALRAHRHFVTQAGLRDNPFWLPNSYLASASLREQVSFLLGRVVPEWEGMVLAPGADGQAALGAAPGWLPASDLGPMAGLGTRWKIRCFGRLRVYTSASRQVDWQIPGGSPRKTKTLFAYLLTRGENGAATDRIAELLWPEEGDEAVKRARLHHTVAMLRKVLGAKSHVERLGDYYHLRLPPGTWVDIETFEQFCRRAKALERAGRHEAAFAMLLAADRLYTGDLFEDLPPEYLDGDGEDWCLAQRAWLRDMALKVRRDMAASLRRRGKLRDAIKHCRRALEMDPACEIAHEEAMRIFHAQGRHEAVVRQYRQYVDALRAIGGDAAYPPLQPVFQGLVSGH
jgi:DNA-binding SARP family transcriptional activator